jgi:hypothetical protein
MSGIGAAKQTGASAVTLRWDCPDMGIMIRAIRLVGYVAGGDSPEPSVVIDSRSCRSAPSCFERGIDGGKKIRGVKIQIAVEKYGIPLAIDVSPANRHDTKAIVPVLRELADGGFQGPAPGRGWPRFCRRSRWNSQTRGSRLPGQVAGRSRSGTGHHCRGDCSRPGRTVHSRRHLLSG